MTDIIEADKDGGIYGDGGICGDGGIYADGGLYADGGIYTGGGLYADEVLSFSINAMDYTGKKVLAVPRCCQRKKDTQDRRLILSMVAER